VNRSPAPGALVPVGVVTVTSTVPVPAGAVAVICVALTGVNEVAGVPPKLTPVAPVKFVPVTVTVVPPAWGPDAGLIDDTTGPGAGINVTVACAVAVAANPFESVPDAATVSVWESPARPVNEPVKLHDGLVAPGASVTPISASHVLPARVARFP
jgi:hypothetical protein